MISAHIKTIYGIKVRILKAISKSTRPRQRRGIYFPARKSMEPGIITALYFSRHSRIKTLNLGIDYDRQSDTFCTRVVPDGAGVSWGGGYTWMPIQNFSTTVT